MDANLKATIEKLKNDQGAVQALLGSRDGQKLMRMLTQNDNGAALQQATQSAAQGNTEDLTKMLSQLMQSGEGAAIMNRINEAAKQKNQ